MTMYAQVVILGLWNMVERFKQNNYRCIKQEWIKNKMCGLASI